MDAESKGARLPPYIPPWQQVFGLGSPLLRCMQCILWLSPYMFLMTSVEIFTAPGSREMQSYLLATGIVGSWLKGVGFRSLSSRWGSRGSPGHVGLVPSGHLGPGVRLEALHCFFPSRPDHVAERRGRHVCLNVQEPKDRGAVLDPLCHVVFIQSFPSFLWFLSIF